MAFLQYMPYNHEQKGAIYRMKEVEITKEPVELHRILKFEGMVASGGEAKHVIAEVKCP